MNKPHARASLPQRVLLLGVTASFLAVPAAGLQAPPASAQPAQPTPPAQPVPPNACTLGNGSFENPPGLPGPGNLRRDVPSWHTTSTDGLIEIWRPGKGATGTEIPADSGTQFAEMNGTQVSTFYQDVTTNPKTFLVWRLAHRARSTSADQKDVIRVKIGMPGSMTVQIPLGRTTGDIADGGTAWGHYMGIYRIPKGQNTTRISIESVSSAAGSPSYGNFLDSVEIGCSPPCPKVRFPRRSCDSVGLPLPHTPATPPAHPSTPSHATAPLVREPLLPRPAR